MTLPGTTSERIVTLTLAATGATEIFVSNIGYEREDGHWEEMTETPEWSLAGSGGEAAVYVRFRDAAGNTADASAATIYTAGDLDCGGTAGLEDLILVFQILVGRPLSDTDSDGQIGPAEAVWLLGHIAE